MEINPIPKGEIVHTVYGQGTVIESIARQTTISHFKTVIEYLYDVEIDGKVRRVFNTEIVGHNAKTLHVKNNNVSKEIDFSKRSQSLQQVQLRAEKAHELIQSGILITQACKEADIDLRSYLRRFPK